MIHVTRNGDEIPIKDLTTTHLTNIIKHIERRAEKGVVVKDGVNDGDIIDYWEETIYGEEAKHHLGLRFYVEELAKRQPTKNLKNTLDALKKMQCELEEHVGVIDGYIVAIEKGQLTATRQCRAIAFRAKCYANNALVDLGESIFSLGRLTKDKEQNQ